MTQKWRREKDGLWAVLAWLSILAYRNGAKKEGLGDKLAKIAPGKIPSWSKVCTARRPMHAMVLDSGCSNTVFTWRQKAFCALEPCPLITLLFLIHPCLSAHARHDDALLDANALACICMPCKERAWNSQRYVCCPYRTFPTSPFPELGLRLMFAYLSCKGTSETLPYVATCLR